MSIVVVGSVAFDSLETPYGKRERALGGSANYFSLSASFFSKVKLQTRWQSGGDNLALLRSLLEESKQNEKK
mgnify:CR=1 FL=1